MRRDLGLDGVVDHFTLSSDEADWLRSNEPDQAHVARMRRSLEGYRQLDD
ncbi:hypothetical protein [Streptomyces sp. NPDC090021]